MNDLVIIVPIRKGSSRIKDKHLAKIGDKTITEIKFKQLYQLCAQFKMSTKNIFVSTDSQEVIELAKEYNFTVHVRDKYYAEGHNASFSELVTYLVQECKSVLQFEHVLWTYPVTPLFDEVQYINCILNYRENVVNGKHDSLVSVTEHKEYFWFKGKPLNYEANKNHTYSQLLEPVYKVTNACYIAPADLMLQEEYFIGSNPYMYITPKTSSIDIDTVEDLEFARILNNITK